MVKKILGLVLFWLLIFVAAFVVPRFIEPTGSGFTRGYNRMPLVFGFQCFGVLLALIAAGLTYKNRTKITKGMIVTGFAPLSIYVLVVLLIVISYAIMIIIGLLNR